jgi:hypothetical protein
VLEHLAQKTTVSPSDEEEAPRFRMGQEREVGMGSWYWNSQLSMTWVAPSSRRLVPNASVLTSSMS